MRVVLSTGPLEIVGAPPFRRAAVLAAHPRPKPPMLKLFRMDGGFDLWPNEDDPDYRSALYEANQALDKALWEFYCQESVEDNPPDDWRESPEWLVLAEIGVKSRSLKLDWIEYSRVGCEADKVLLRQAFIDTNSVQEEHREFARLLFGVTWDGLPIEQAATSLKTGKLSYNQPWLEFAVAEQFGLLPLERRELARANKRLRKSLWGKPLYYDLPPRFRALLEVYAESRLLAQALQVEEARRK